MSDAWVDWRARRLAGADPGAMPDPPGRDAEGGWLSGGLASAGATAEAVCHLIMIGQARSAPAVVACDWLEEVRTPAGAWLAAPGEAPADVEGPAGPRVWATAGAACALLASGRDPGDRALRLLQGESDRDGGLTGGLRPTAAAAAAFWLTHGPKTELAEWALRWARESVDEWGPLELTAALVYWAAAAIPPDHATASVYCDALRAELAAAESELTPEQQLRGREALRAMD